MGFKACAVFVAVWHSPADVYENEDAEAVVPIDRQAEGNDRITVYQLPAAQVAAVVHQGDFADFMQGHAALLECGYKTVGPYHEIYIWRKKDSGCIRPESFLKCIEQ